VADDRLVSHLEERVSQLSTQVAEREAMLDDLRVRVAGSQRLAHDAARAVRDRDKARAAERAANQEAAQARGKAQEAQREVSRLRAQLEDEHAFVAGVRDKLARLEAVEERVKTARTLGDLIPH